MGFCLHKEKYHTKRQKEKFKLFWQQEIDYIDIIQVVKHIP